MSLEDAHLYVSLPMVLSISANDVQDLTAATQMARMMVMRLGMSEKLGDVDFSDGYRDLSSGTKELIEQEVRRLIDDARVRATALIISKRKELDLIANALVEYETLSADDLQKVLKGEKLPHKIPILPNVPIKLVEGVYSGPTLEGGPGNTGDVRPAAPRAKTVAASGEVKDVKK